MELREDQQKIYKLLTTDEDFLRLIYYKPSKIGDDPLDPSKPNILDMDEKLRNDFLKDRVIFTPSTDELDSNQICRVIISPGKRKSSRNNFLTSSQEILFDVFAHRDFNDIDLRCSWICEHIQSLLFNKKIIGMKELREIDGAPLSVNVKNYIGYGLTVPIGSGN